jgi:hypothetical protein
LPPPDLWATRRPPRQEPPPQQQQQLQQQRPSAPAAVSPSSGSSTSSRGSSSSGGSRKGTPPAASFSAPASVGLLHRTTVGSGGSFSEREQRQAHDRVADNDDDTETEASASNLAVFLALAKLSQHEATLRLEGYEEVDDLADADDEDLLRAGLKKPEIRRLRRYLSEHE